MTIHGYNSGQCHPAGLQLVGDNHVLLFLSRVMLRYFAFIGNCGVLCSTTNLDPTNAVLFLLLSMSNGDEQHGKRAADIWPV